jgi:hypothetical protein
MALQRLRTSCTSLWRRLSNGATQLRAIHHRAKSRSGGSPSVAPKFVDRSSFQETSPPFWRRYLLVRKSALASQYDSKPKQFTRFSRQLHVSKATALVKAHRCASHDFSPRKAASQRLCVVHLSILRSSPPEKVSWQSAIATTTRSHASVTLPVRPLSSDHVAAARREIKHAPRH